MTFPTDSNSFRRRRKHAVPDDGYFAWLERRRVAPLPGLDPDKPDPRDIVAIEDLNATIAEDVQHFTDELWLSAEGEQFAHAVLDEYLRS